MNVRFALLFLLISLVIIVGVIITSFFIQQKISENNRGLIINHSGLSLRNSHKKFKLGVNSTEKFDEYFLVNHRLNLSTIKVILIEVTDVPIQADYTHTYDGQTPEYAYSFGKIQDGQAHIKVFVSNSFYSRQTKETIAYLFEKIVLEQLLRDSLNTTDKNILLTRSQTLEEIVTTKYPVQLFVVYDT